MYTVARMCQRLAIHNSYSADVASIDFSKVCHTKLIRKLASVGIGGKLLLWMNDYLPIGPNVLKLVSVFHLCPTYAVVYLKEV